MAADANIFLQHAQPVRSVLDYSSDLDKQESNKLALMGQRRQNELAGITIDQQRQQAMLGVAKQNALQAMANDPSMADPVARENAMLNHPLLSAEGQALRKARLDAGEVQARTDKEKSIAGQNTEATQAAQFDRGIRDVLAFDTPEAARAHMQAAIDSGKLPPDRAQALLGSMPQDPAQFPAWQMKTLRTLMSAKDQNDAAVAEQKRLAPTPTETKLGNRIAFIDTNPNSPTYRQEVAQAAIGQSPDNAATNATSRANNAATQAGEDRRAKASRDASMSKPFEVTGADGSPVLVQQDKAGNITPVEGYAPKGPKLRDIPPAVNAKIIEGQQGLTNIDQAIAAVKSNPGAFGMVNAVPGVERLRQGDTNGVDARAQVANIGSLKLHDRSGAAVSASEFPRLAPFIPSSSDNAEAIVTKLQKMKQIAEGELGLFADTYGEGSGYRPSPVLAKRAAASDSKPASVTGGWSITPVK